MDGLKVVDLGDEDAAIFHTAGHKLLIATQRDATGAGGRCNPLSIREVIGAECGNGPVYFIAGVENSTARIAERSGVGADVIHLALCAYFEGFRCRRSGQKAL